MKALLRSLLVAAVCTWSFGASAQLQLEPTEITFGAPGQVFFDATGTKKVFPLPREIREFASWVEYFQFLENELNALIVRDPDTGAVSSISIDAQSLDRPMWLDRELQQFLPVKKPLFAFIGGKSGYVHIAGELFCVNRRICGDLPPAGPPQEFTISPDLMVFVDSDYVPHEEYVDDDADPETAPELAYFEYFNGSAYIGIEDWASILEAHERRCRACDTLLANACVDIDCDSVGDDFITAFYPECEFVPAAASQDTVTCSGWPLSNKAEWVRERLLETVRRDHLLDLDRAKSFAHVRVWYDGSEGEDQCCEGPACPR